LSFVPSMQPSSSSYRPSDDGPSNATDSDDKETLKRKLEEALKKIAELKAAKNRVDCDLYSAKKNIQGKEADLVRANESIAQLQQANNRQHRELTENQYETDRLKEEYRNYMTEVHSKRHEMVQIDETPRNVLYLMRNCRKRFPLPFPLTEDDPHYPIIFKKPRTH
ncbi:hypothetical protein PFISCL1PPCAC_10146, partial [Pristionchus fissidentatus]